MFHFQYTKIVSSSSSFCILFLYIYIFLTVSSLLLSSFTYHCKLCMNCFNIYLNKNSLECTVFLNLFKWHTISCHFNFIYKLYIVFLQCFFCYFLFWFNKTTQKMNVSHSLLQSRRFGGTWILPVLKMDTLCWCVLYIDYGSHFNIGNILGIVLFSFSLP